jgi:hypothetical protein
VLSLVDTAVDRDDAFGPDWPVARLRAVRTALEYVIFALLELRLRTIEPHYRTFLEQLYAGRPAESITIVSLNYDLIADNALAAVSEHTQRPGLPDYGCDIATPAYRELPATFGLLLKLHGSLNWLYCPNCHRLDLGIAPSGRRTVKMLPAFYGTVDLDESYSAGDGTPCADCGTHLRPVLITPTHLKDYRNPHIARVWYEAGRELRKANRAIFVGYSLPEDDVDVIYLFKRGLAHLPPRAITVVEHAAGADMTLDRNPVGLRYRALFGDEIDWYPKGFERWLHDFRPPAGRSAASPRRPRAARS